MWFWGVQEWARIWSALLSSRARTPWAPVAARFPLTSRSCTTRSTCCSTTSKGSISSTVSTFTTPSAMSLISCRLSKSFSTHPTSANSYPCCALSYPARTSCCSTSTHRKGFIWRRICWQPVSSTSARKTSAARTRMLEHPPCTFCTSPSRPVPVTDPCARLRFSAPRLRGQRQRWCWKRLMKSAKLRWKGARATKAWDSAYGVGQSMELASMCLWWSRDHPLRERGSELETRSCKSITWCLTESLMERQSRWCVISVFVCEWTCVFGSVLNISHHEKSIVDLLSLKLFTEKMRDIFGGSSDCRTDGNL